MWARGGGEALISTYLHLLNPHCLLSRVFFESTESAASALSPQVQRQKPDKKRPVQAKADTGRKHGKNTIIFPMMPGFNIYFFDLFPIGHFLISELISISCILTFVSVV